jgi:Nucleotidyltransferase domain
MLETKGVYTLIANDCVLSKAETSVIKTLLYFNLFNYPLTIEEIEKYSTHGVNGFELKETVQRLLYTKLIFAHGEFYSVNQDKGISESRIAENELAKEMMPKARQYSKIISLFPFVRGVFISGSLSKGVMKKDGDVDYFIITKANRLWVCRTLLVLFKKIFLLNSHKYFCVNYFVDEENLEIREKNIFTATEIVSLIPMYNFSLYLSFIAANKWIFELLPNSTKPFFISHKSKQPFIKRAIEFLLKGKTGEKLDNFFLLKTLAFWKNKYRHSSSIDFTDSIRAKSNVAKYHPNQFQEKVLQKLTEECITFEVRTGYCFSC